MFLLEIDSTNEHNKFVDEWSAHGQSDINLEHKSQVVADTGTKSDMNLEHKGPNGGRHQNKPTNKNDSHRYWWAVFFIQ